MTDCFQLNLKKRFLASQLEYGHSKVLMISGMSEIRVDITNSILCAGKACVSTVH